MSYLKIGGFADLHYDTGSKASRALKCDAFVAAMESWSPNFIIQLGDLLDNGWDGDKWDTVGNKLNAFSGDNYYVYGNHEYQQYYDDPSQGDTRNSWLAKTGYASSYYSFESGDYHIIVLDSNYNEDDTDTYPVSWARQYMRSTQLTWLTADLAATEKPTVVFIHARLDGYWSAATGYNVFVMNGREVRAILESSGKVFAVIMGHDQQDYRTIHGIHYIGLYQPWNGTYPTSPYSKIELYDRNVVVTSVDGGVNYDTRNGNGTNPFESTLTIRQG